MAYEDIIDAGAIDRARRRNGVRPEQLLFGGDKTHGDNPKRKVSS